MIDYFKAFINYRNDTRFKELKEAGTFAVAVETTDTGTGEVKEAYLYKNMSITPTGAGFILAGSLHKYRSIIKGIATCEQIDKHQGYNGDLFTLQDITEIIAHLCGVLDISPHVCTLQNIEIGVNNVVTFAPFDFLKGVLYHRNDYSPTIKHGGNYIQFEHNEYYIKLYNKGRQYELPNNVIRVEIKVMKMRKLIEAGINISTLADINESTLKQAFDLLYNEFNEVIYYDYSLKTDGLTEAKQRKVLEYQNRTFWEGLTKKERYRERDRLSSLIDKHSDNYKGQIQRQMIAGYNATIEGKAGEYTLPAAPQPTRANQGVDNTPQNTKLGTVSPAYDNTPQNTKLGTVSPFKYRVRTYPEGLKKEGEKEGEKVIEKTPQKEAKNGGLKRGKKEPSKSDKKPLSKDYPRKCVITGISLELEKENARYIQTNTIRRVKDTDGHLYSLLCSLLLPHTGVKPVFEKTIINQLAKQVRNRYYNKSEGTRSVMQGGDLKKQLSLDL
uniref:Uncharacterized protein n=1 Tax=Siphoviridae sp. ctOsn3 TaxID=2823577 RepID=A0A8S5LGK9_9CAUD|nr:MAG TPA: hypothetical protein [Siphoviridae sp. ctOsn3]